MLLINLAVAGMSDIVKYVMPKKKNNKKVNFTILKPNNGYSHV